MSRRAGHPVIAMARAFPATSVSPASGAAGLPTSIRGEPAARLKSSPAGLTNIGSAVGESPHVGVASVVTEKALVQLPVIPVTRTPAAPTTLESNVAGVFWTKTSYPNTPLLTAVTFRRMALAPLTTAIAAPLLAKTLSVI